MHSTLHLENTIAEIIREHPETRSVFTGYGLEALISEQGLRVLAPILRLSTALHSRGIASERFLEDLHRAAAVEQKIEAPGLSSYNRQGELALLALMPCGVKMGFGRALTEFLEQLKNEQQMPVAYAVEGNVNQELSYYAYVHAVTEASEFPDIIISSDFNTFFGRDFYRKFVEGGCFTGYGQPDTTETYRKAGIPDPLGQYSILGINPLVIVANLDQLNGRALPKTWQDLLTPQWERSITLRGGDGFFCHAVLLPTYQRFGAAGLQALSANVLQGLHPSRMIKQIDTNGPGALYVMPEFFALRAQKQERLAIIWPEEGALASPITLQVKADRIEYLRPVLDYLTGPDLAEYLAGARFPVPHRQVPGEVQDRPVYWLGWDYLREHDLLELNQEIDRIFLPGIEER